jgi:2-phosphosulfolactate phosphatase
MNTIDVCFSPAYFRRNTLNSNEVVVVIDVLRATTAIAAALSSNAEKVVPVSTLNQLRELKAAGYLTAAERDGLKVDFADFGNSPSIFLQHDLTNKVLAYSTTNGTRAIEAAAGNNPLILASFVNISSVIRWLAVANKSVFLFCSGWKDDFSLEDTLCAGFIGRQLSDLYNYTAKTDACCAAIALWDSAGSQLKEFVKKASHYQRLLAMGLTADLDLCFTTDSINIVPVFNEGAFVKV